VDEPEKGGWILSVDKFNPALDFTYNTSRDTTIQIGQPDIEKQNATARNHSATVVMQYMNDFETALFGDNFMDRL
jgi:hypothetical protein